MDVFNDAMHDQVIYVDDGGMLVMSYASESSDRVVNMLNESGLLVSLVAQHHVTISINSRRLTIKAHRSITRIAVALKFAIEDYNDSYRNISIEVRSIKVSIDIKF